MEATLLIWAKAEVKVPGSAVCSQVTPSLPPWGKWVILVTWHASSVGSAVIWGLRTGSRFSVKLGSGKKKGGSSKLNSLCWGVEMTKQVLTEPNLLYTLTQFHPGREPLQIYVQVQDGYILKLDIMWSPSLILCQLLKQQNPIFTEGVEVRWNKHGATWDTCLQRQHSPQHTRPNKCNKSPTQNLCEGKQLQLRGKVLHCTTKQNTCMTGFPGSIRKRLCQFGVEERH